MDDSILSFVLEDMLEDELFFRGVLSEAARDVLTFLKEHAALHFDRLALQFRKIVGEEVKVSHDLNIIKKKLAQATLTHVSPSKGFLALGFTFYLKLSFRASCFGFRKYPAFYWTTTRSLPPLWNFSRFNDTFQSAMITTI